MCEQNPDCKFHKIAKLTAQYAQHRDNATRLVLEAALKDAGSNLPFACLYQGGDCATRVTALEAAFLAYATHRPDCELNGEVQPGMRCTCGLAAAMRRVGL